MSGTLDDPPSRSSPTRPEQIWTTQITPHQAEGGMAGVSDRWLDGGHRIPSHVADTRAESLQSPGDRRGPHCWSRAGAPDVAVCGTGMLAANGGGGRWGWTARTW
jgi:hypothetical protein